MGLEDRLMWIDDQVLMESHQDICLKTWVPNEAVVVLGRSNKRGTEANRAACEADAVPILKRLGGGGTVILHDQCLVVSCGLWVKDYYKNDLYFRHLNQSIIDVFQSQLPAQGFTQRGYSDIVLGDKKLVGTSLSQPQLSPLPGLHTRRHTRRSYGNLSAASKSRTRLSPRPLPSRLCNGFVRAQRYFNWRLAHDF